jgi:hypothetical protein
MRWCVRSDGVEVDLVVAGVGAELVSVKAQVASSAFSIAGAYRYTTTVDHPGVADYETAPR